MYSIYEFDSKATKKRNVQNKMSTRYEWIRMHAPKKKTEETNSKHLFQIHYYHIQLDFDFVAIILDITCGVHWKYVDLFVISTVSPLSGTISRFRFTRPLILIMKKLSCFAFMCTKNNRRVIFPPPHDNNETRVVSILDLVPFWRRRITRLWLTKTLIIQSIRHIRQSNAVAVLKTPFCGCCFFLMSIEVVILRYIRFHMSCHKWRKHVNSLMAESNRRCVCLLRCHSSHNSKHSHIIYALNIGSFVDSNLIIFHRYSNQFVISGWVVSI